MWFLFHFRSRTESLAPTQSSGLRQPPRSRRAAPPLAVEQLEPRWCPSYTITDLGTFGGAQSYAYAINSMNEVVGQAEVASGPNHAFFYSGGNKTDLGVLGSDVYSRALAVNDSHQVVGYSGSGGTAGIFHAFSWQIGGQMTDMGNLGSANTTARAINSAGQVVGDGVTTAGVDHACFWQSITASITDLNSQPGVVGSGWVLSQAWGINDNQQIVGQGTFNGEPPHAFLWTWNSGVAPTDLGVLVTGASSIGTAINLSGQVAGISNTTGGPANGFLWTSPGPMTDLPPLRKDVFSRAYALNDLSSPQVVGYSEDAGAGFHAVLWQNGKVTDLTSQLPRGSGWNLQFAYGINHGGAIVGIGNDHAFLMTPSGTPSAAVAALPSGAILSSSSIAPSSPVLAHEPFLANATVSNPAPGGRQALGLSAVTAHASLLGRSSDVGAITPNRSALKLHEWLFTDFADEFIA
jgi:probable HAF family extracellular repeat protein